MKIVAILVVLAILALAGLVLIDHYAPPVIRVMDAWTLPAPTVNPVSCPPIDPNVKITPTPCPEPKP